MIDLQILYEDNHLIAVNKPAGMLSQGDVTGDVSIDSLTKLYLKKKYNKPGNVYCSLIHRLDRPTSGVLLMARTTKAMQRMSAIFKNREIKKVYWALTKNRPRITKNTLEHRLLRNNKKNITRIVKKYHEDAKKAILEYEMKQAFKNKTLIEVHPKTGRQHQIRVQLAFIGCPIIGDLKYGYPTANHDLSICLHARSLEFIHPVKKENIRLTAAVPSNDLWEEFK